MESVHGFCGSKVKRCLPVSKKRSHVITVMDQLIMTRLLLGSGTSVDHIGPQREGKQCGCFFYLSILTCDISVLLFSYFFVRLRRTHGRSITLKELLMKCTQSICPVPLWASPSPLFVSKYPSFRTPKAHRRWQVTCLLRARKQK